MGGRSRWDGFPNSWGYKRAGRQSGRGKRRKQTSVYVSSLCRASISEQRDYLPSGQGGKEEEFGGERSFGLSCAPRIMTAILGKVLSMDERVRRGTDHYIDDIVVRESVLSAQELREHLARYGLESKAPEGLDGGRVLGISLRKGSGGHLEMSRGMALSEIVMDQSKLTKRGLFSLCGRLVGHYPVAGWLRPCCSFLKRLGCGGSWDEPVESSVGELANELLVRARAEDPVRGRWHVSPHGTVTVWTDASSLGMGVALEVDGSVAEDASWLRKESDHRHINVAELEAVARGINLAISWGFKTFTVATDSRTVISWMDNTVEGHRRVRTKGASEMLIKRRLGVIRDTITEFGLTVTVRFVSTTENKADRMTRVPKKWLGHRDTGEEGADVSAALATGESVEDAIWAAHLPHHLGVDRTLYLARQIRSNLTREQVKRELVGCEACQRIDPARREENLVAQGSLAVDGNWRRVAVDVTHYGAKHYLSMVDCGPSRFAIWRRLSSETAASIIAQLQGIVIERGPCDEFLLDNSTAFRSAAVEQFADEWGISLRFRAAYAPSGNGIVERNHRTIKRIAERGGISPEEATFWYNVTPRKDTDAGSVPSNGLYRYTWRVPFDVNLAKVESFEDSPFAVGDEVWVKPPIPSCTRQWSLGIVSDVVSRYVVRVDGMPRHVKDIRKRRYGSNRGVVHGDRVDTAGPVEPAVLSGGDASYADSTFWRTGAPYQSAPTPGLVNYMLTFCGESKHWHGSYASIEPSSGDDVWGVIWKLDDSDKQHLDKQEHNYDCISVDIECENGTFMTSCTYIAKPEYVNMPSGRKPSLCYKQVLVTGAKENCLPSNYIENLEAIEDNGNSEQPLIKGFSWP
ncbi:Gamma-glutamylcyclotransferase [Nymphon striatum]|nr:Gamma-glutamylcyclotransferase [Nymphon striatum]